MCNVIERELELEARAENFFLVKDLIRSCLIDTSCGETAVTQVCMAAEEIFTNIAYYAYEGGETGTAVIRIKADKERNEIELVFTDSGKKYDPLAGEDPDITLSARERRVGGLGIFMAKHVMDEICYEYRDLRNILTMKKHWD